MIQLASTAPTYNTVRSKAVAAQAVPPPSARAGAVETTTSAAVANARATSTRLRIIERNPGYEKNRLTNGGAELTEDERYAAGNSSSAVGAVSAEICGCRRTAAATAAATALAPVGVRWKPS